VVRVRELNASKTSGHNFFSKWVILINNIKNTPSTSFLLHLTVFVITGSSWWSAMGPMRMAIWVEIKEILIVKH